MGLKKFVKNCFAPCGVEAYKNTHPTMDLQSYFSGRIRAWGIVQNYSGKVTRRFDVRMTGKWQDNTGVLEEIFDYYDGESQKRIWTITQTNENKYEGRADDIIDKATGEVAGNAMRWAYQMDLTVGDKTYRIKFDDWMFLMNDGVLINRSYLKKFGLTVAQLSIFMQKQD